MKKIGTSKKETKLVVKESFEKHKKSYSKDERKAIKDTAHLNHMGNVSYDISNPVHQLRVAAASCFFGEPSYYDKNMRIDLSKKQVRKIKKTQVFNELPMSTLTPLLTLNFENNDNMNYMESLIDKALATDAKATLELAVQLRNEFNIRLTPQVIMVRAANHPNVRQLTKETGTSVITEFANQIIKRADEPVAQMTYQLAAFGKPIPNVLKRSWAKFLETQSEYAIAKYRNNTGTPYKLVDVVNMVHAKSETIDQLMKGTLRLDENNETWESLISREGSSKETWTKAVEIMGHMALLRNLRNLLQHNVDTSLYVQKLIDGVKGGKQLPFRYYSAYKSVESVDSDSRQVVLDALEDCMTISLDNLPKLSGRVASLSDNSGSAHSPLSSLSNTKVSHVGNLMAVITGYINNDNKTDAFVFGDKLKKQPISQRKGILNQAKELNKLGETVGQSTENGIWIFLRDVLKNKTHYDHVFIYSDMQAGHGGLYGVDSDEYQDYIACGNRIDVPKLIREYHQTVNPNCKFYLVQTAGYTDTIVPEFYKNVYILSGWSEAIFQFAHEMSNLDK